MWESSVSIDLLDEPLEGSARLFGAGCREMLIFATAPLSLKV